LITHKGAGQFGCRKKVMFALVRLRWGGGASSHILQAFSMAAFLRDRQKGGRAGCDPMAAISAEYPDVRQACF